MATSSLPQRISRPPSRPSSQASFRAPSPSQNHAQTQTPRRPPGHITSPASPQFSPVQTSTPASASSKRRSSYDVLASLAANGKGPDSLLPLPIVRNAQPEEIREGIPTDFSGTTPQTPNTSRSFSPTRSMSRIPVSSVGHARALAEEGNSLDNISAADISITSIREPPSPGGMRKSLGGGGTTKVLADLQAGVLSAKAALENTKSQLRASQRTVAQLTRQTEDLKDGRERLRLENEGLNNVVARKERLLQEVLERARKAEAEAIALKAQLKSETSTSKRTIREMEAATAEAVALSQKSEREYLTLRDSLSSMTEGWKAEVRELKTEMKRREDRWAKDAEEMGAKYRTLVKLVQKSERPNLDETKASAQKVQEQLETYFRDEIATLSKVIETSSEQAGAAERTSQELSAELARLRRLMRSTSRVFAAADIQLPPGPE